MRSTIAWSVSIEISISRSISRLRLTTSRCFQTDHFLPSTWPSLVYPWIGKIDNRMELSSFPESFHPRLLPFSRNNRMDQLYPDEMIVKMMVMMMLEREISAFVLWSCTMQRTNLNEVCKWIVWQKIHFHQTIINLKAEIQNEPTSATHFLLQILGDVSKLMDQDRNMGEFWKSSWRKVSTTR